MSNPNASEPTISPEDKLLAILDGFAKRFDAIEQHQATTDKSLSTTVDLIAKVASGQPRQGGGEFQDIMRLLNGFIGEDNTPSPWSSMQTEWANLGMAMAQKTMEWQIRDFKKRLGLPAEQFQRGLTVD